MPFPTGLADFLDTLFTDYKTNRALDEKKWQRNLDAINGIPKKPWKSGEATDWRSTTSIKYIKAKIFAAFVQILDIFLQNGNIPFALKRSPFQPQDYAEGEEEAKEAAIEEMTNKIKEQLKDRKADREAIKKILSLGYYGMAWSKYNVLPVEKKYYVPVEDELNAMLAGGAGAEQQPYELPTKYELLEYDEPCPGHEYRSLWSMFTDKEDEDLQINQGTFENGLTSSFELRLKIGQPHYIETAIEHVIAQYNESESVKDAATLLPGQRDIAGRKKGMNIKEFWGRAPTEFVEAFEFDLAFLERQQEGNYTGELFSEINIGDAEITGYETEVLVEMVEKTIIRYVRRPERKRPFKRCYWEEALDELTGIGIADNLDDVQDMLIGMIRAFEDNKKLSANVITAIKRRFIAPGQDETVRPGKEIELSEACPDARQAIVPIIIPDVGESLLSGIGLGQSLADRVGHIPEIIAGTTLPKHKPDTLGEMNWLMENAGKYLGMVIRNNDEYFVEPEINDIYDYNMVNPDYDGKKVSCVVHATGFSGFQNRMVRQNKLMQVLSLILSDEALREEAKLRPHLKEIYDAADLDPDIFLKSTDEKREEAKDRATMQAEAKAQAEESIAMQVEAKIAEIQAQSAAKMAEIEAQLEGKLEELAAQADAKIEEIEIKGDIDAELAEDEFEREVAKEILSDNEPEGGR